MALAVGWSLSFVFARTRRRDAKTLGRLHTKAKRVCTCNKKRAAFKLATLFFTSGKSVAENSVNLR
jgi:hypothetical protein